MAKKKRTPRKSGRPFIRDRTELTPREEEYAVLVASGMSIEEASLQIGVTTKEAIRWHKELQPMVPRIAELRQENYEELSEQVLGQHYKILLQLSEQIERKLEEGATLSPQELKAMYSMHGEITPVIEQHRYKREQYEKGKVSTGKGFLIEMKEKSLLELMSKVDHPDMKEFALVSTARWYKALKSEHQNRFLKLIEK